MGRLKNRLIAKALTRFPYLVRFFTGQAAAVSFDEAPWAPLRKPLAESRMALVTTGGVHLRGDRPFDMSDSTGDPSFRVVPSDTSVEALTITHDYYDHKDADRDINIVFPIERLREFAEEGGIGSLSRRFFGFMGHLEQNHFNRFLNEEIPAAVAMMKDDGVDIALLTPG